MDIMDIWEMSAKGPNRDVEYKMLKAGDTVKLVRMVTMEYVVNVSDYLDKADETGIAVKVLIERELDAMGVSDVLDNEGKSVITDDTVIAVISE